MSRWNSSSRRAASWVTTVGCWPQAGQGGHLLQRFICKRPGASLQPARGLCRLLLRFPGVRDPGLVSFWACSLSLQPRGSFLTTLEPSPKPQWKQCSFCCKTTWRKTVLRKDQVIFTKNFYSSPASPFCSPIKTICKLSNLSHFLRYLLIWCFLVKLCACNFLKKLYIYKFVYLLLIFADFIDSAIELMVAENATRNNVLFNIRIILSWKQLKTYKLLAFPYLLKSRTQIFKAVPLLPSIRKDKSESPYQIL